jgi:hypothetical protein
MTKSEMDAVRRIVREEITSLLTQMTVAMHQELAWEHDTVMNTSGNLFTTVMNRVATSREKEDRGE